MVLVNIRAAFTASPVSSLPGMPLSADLHWNGTRCPMPEGMSKEATVGQKLVGSACALFVSIVFLRACRAGLESLNMVPFYGA